MINVRWTRGAAALLLGVALAACERQPAAVPVETDPFAGLGPGIHPVLVVAAQDAESARVELYLKRVEVSEQVASYQGELRYDVGRMKLSAAELPSGVAGVWNEVEPGRVRFAAAAPGGVGDAPALTLRFAPQGRIERTAFTLNMEEVVASQAFANITAKVVKQTGDRPLFSATPLADGP